MRWSAPWLRLMPRSLHHFNPLGPVLHMIGETIIAGSNGTHLPFGFRVIQEFRDRAKLLSSLAPILGIVDVRMGQSDHAKLPISVRLLPTTSTISLANHKIS